MSNKAKVVEQVQEQTSPSSKDLIAKWGNKSKAIRGLTSEGKTRSEVAKLLNIRYQHVRNVLITPIKKG